MNGLRINILALAAIGTALICALAFITNSGSESQMAVLAIAGTFVGGFAGVMVRLVEPEPDPSVPASIVERILAGGGGATSGLEDLAVAAPGSVWRGNVIVLSLIAGVVVLIMLWALPDDIALVTIAGGFVGGLVSLAGKLVEPPPNPAVPASVVKWLIDGQPKDRPMGSTGS